MRRLATLLIGLMLAAGCAAQTADEPVPTPADLLTQAADRIRAAETFRMTVERTGAAYFITTDLGDAVFRRAEVQYVAPDAMQAKVRVLAAGLPIDLDFLFLGEKQWLRGIWTNNIWVSIAFAPGFTPAALIAEQTGFQAAIQSLTELQLVGRDQLVDGTPVWHLKAAADGEDVSAFMAGLIEVLGPVTADVYIHRETLLPVQFTIVQPDTVTADEPEPTTWVIEIFDFDRPASIDNPETTPES